jgi:hypothetical protein
MIKTLDLESVVRSICTLVSTSMLYHGFDGRIALFSRSVFFFLEVTNAI